MVILLLHHGGSNWFKVIVELVREGCSLPVYRGMPLNVVASRHLLIDLFVKMLPTLLELIRTLLQNSDLIFQSLFIFS
jgi:hypothetical protein